MLSNDHTYNYMRGNKLAHFTTCSIHKERDCDCGMHILPTVRVFDNELLVDQLPVVFLRSFTPNVPEDGSDVSWVQLYNLIYFALYPHADREAKPDFNETRNYVISNLIRWRERAEQNHRNYGSAILERDYEQHDGPA